MNRLLCRGVGMQEIGLLTSGEEQAMYFFQTNSPHPTRLYQDSLLFSIV